MSEHIKPGKGYSDPPKLRLSTATAQKRKPVTQFTAARAHLTALWQDLDHEQDTNGTKEHAKTLADLLAADKALACHAALVEALKAAELELREIISFTVVEKIALRRPEIDSINVVAAAARGALKAAGVSS